MHERLSAQRVLELPHGKCPLHTDCRIDYGTAALKVGLCQANKRGREISRALLENRTGVGYCFGAALSMRFLSLPCATTRWLSEISNGGRAIYQPILEDIMTTMKRVLVGFFLALGLLGESISSRAQGTSELLAGTTAQWWQYAISIPTTVNPLLDATGDDCRWDSAIPSCSWLERSMEDRLHLSALARFRPENGYSSPSSIACRSILPVSADKRAA